MTYRESPKDFKSKFDVTSCLLEYNGEILLLLRNDDKPEGNTWCLPGGKVDGTETTHESMIRELKEETGHSLSKENKLIYFGKFYVRYPTYDFIYHIFYLPVTEKPFIQINPKEHKDFNWHKPTEALKLSLIPDLDSCIKLFYKIA